LWAMECGAPEEIKDSRNQKGCARDPRAAFRLDQR